MSAFMAGPVPGESTGFRHATLNVNGPTEGKLDTILIWVMHDSIDSLLLVNITAPGQPSHTGRRLSPAALTLPQKCSMH